MSIRKLTCVVAAALFLLACDDTTNELGTSLTPNLDNLDMSTDTFQIASRSLIADSVYARTTTGYLGKIRDPETDAYITGNFMTQFHVVEDYENTFPQEDSITSRNDKGEIVADSCEIRLYYTSFYGDSLAPMKLKAYEMTEPMLETQRYYSNFDPKTGGYILPNAYQVEKTYTLADLSVSDSLRQSDSYTSNIRIPLNDSLVGRDGKAYDNYGSYIMNRYYADKKLFGDPLKFIKQVQPGFYFEHTGGLGSMAYILASQLVIYFHFTEGDSIRKGTVIFGGTEEVLQTTRVENDKQTISRLAADNTCTYIKSPAGIFTELTLPVDEVLRGHEADSINMASLVLPRINNTRQSNYALESPTRLLLIPKDSLYTFFENGRLMNNRTSFLSESQLSTTNSYSFTNISNLIAAMNENRQSENWNKVVLVPVAVTISTTSTSQRVVKISHEMALTSTRLVGGTENPHAPIKMSVVYSRFK